MISQFEIQYGVRVLSLPALRAFWAAQPEAQVPLRAWFNALEAATPHHLDDLKKLFGSVDYVPDKHDQLGFYVFDIGGNKWRILCKINFSTQYTLIKKVLTHKEYEWWTKENR